MAYTLESVLKPSRKLKLGRQMSQIDEFTPAFCGLVTSELPGRWAIWTFKTPS
jgi:hypothetical protein